MRTRVNVLSILVGGWMLNSNLLAANVELLPEVKRPDSFFASGALHVERVFDCSLVASATGGNNRICIDRGLNQRQKDYARTAMEQQVKSGFEAYFSHYSVPALGDLYVWSREDSSPCNYEWVYDTSKLLSCVDIAPNCSFDNR